MHGGRPVSTAVCHRLTENASWDYDEARRAALPTDSEGTNNPCRIAARLAASAAESPRCLWRPTVVSSSGSIRFRSRRAVYGATSARITSEEVGSLCFAGGLQRMQVHLCAPVPVSRISHLTRASLGNVPGQSAYKLCCSAFVCRPCRYLDMFSSLSSR